MRTMLAGWLALGVGTSAGAATVLDTTAVLPVSAEAAAQLPPVYQFTLNAEGSYTVTLRDLSLPTRFESLRALITRDLQSVAQLAIQYPSDPNNPAPPDSETFAGTPGTYRVHVLGAVDPEEAAGLFEIEVTPANGGAAAFEVAEAITAASGPAPQQSVLRATFDAPAAGTYQLTLTDRAFPAPLAAIDFQLLSSGASVAVSPTGEFNVAAAGPFELIVLATAGGADLAGSYGATITGGPANATIYRSENPVGRLPPSIPVNVTSAGAHTLTLTDLEFPEALTSFSAALIQNGMFVASVTGGTPGNITLSAGPAQLFVHGSAATTGALSATLAQGAQIDYADVHIFDASPDTTTPAIYSFTPSQPVAAGTYTLTVEDFRFPALLPSLAAVIVQGGTVAHAIEDAGSEPVTLQAGPVQVLVAATPPAGSGTTPGNGMFALSLKTPANDALVFESTQGVGGLFKAQAMSLSTAGRYDIGSKDFEFPSRLRSSWLAITRGTTLVGQVIGSSTIQNLQLEAGLHVVNFLGQPASGASYGTFGVKVADSVASPPLVSLTATPSTVNSSQTTTLEWSAANATSCTASGGWSGTKNVSGSQSSEPLIANTTFQIECVGPGGRDDASVTVTVNAASPRRGGGGGHIDPVMLVSLLTMLAVAHARRRRRETM